MKVTNHAKLSILLSVPAAYMTDPLTGVVGCLIGGVLMDSDHVIDYYLNYRIPFNREGFLNPKLVKSLILDSTLKVTRMLRPIKRNPDGPVRSFVIFHTIEFWLLIIPFMGNIKPFLFPVIIGWTGHLVSDYLTWKRPWYAFSFIYRYFKGFDLDESMKYMNRLRETGIDLTICRDCGMKGIQELHYEPIGGDYRKGPIENFVVLCPGCHDLRHERHSKS